MKLSDLDTVNDLMEERFHLKRLKAHAENGGEITLAVPGYGCHEVPIPGHLRDEMRQVFLAVVTEQLAEAESRLVSLGVEIDAKADMLVVSQFEF